MYCHFSARVDVWQHDHDWYEQVVDGETYVFLSQLLPESRGPGIPQEREGDYRYYDPLKEEPALFHIYAELEPTKEAIVDFVKEYGQPASCLTEFQHDIRVMCAAVDLWKAIRAEDRRALHTYVVRTERGKLKLGNTPLRTACATFTFPPRIGLDGERMGEDQLKLKPPPLWSEKAYNRGDLVGPAGDLLDWVIEQFLPDYSTVHLIRLPNGALTYQFEVTDLFTALWLQFATAVAEDKEFRYCELGSCGKPFELSPRVTRNDRRFCSNVCRTRAHRLRVAKAVQMRKKGASLREIASAVGSKMKQVKKWVGEG